MEHKFINKIEFRNNIKKFIISGIPILTFHAVHDDCENYSIRKKDFIGFLIYLKEEGYRTIRVEELLGIRKEGIIDSKLLALTFDDGLASQIDIAAEYLYKYGFTATFFLISSFIKKERESSFLGKNKYVFMSLDDIKNLVKGRFDIGSHSHSHRLLGTLSQNEVIYEITQSVKDLEDKAGIPIISFAYPYGRWGSYNNFVKKCLSDNHIKLAFTQMGYRANVFDDLLLIPRINIDYSDKFIQIKNKINGYYDILGRARSCFYKIKGIITGKQSISLL